MEGSVSLGVITSPATGVDSHFMMDDLEAQPLPTPSEPVTQVQKTKSIIEWMCFFLIYWQ